MSKKTKAATEVMEAVEAVMDAAMEATAEAKEESEAVEAVMDAVAANEAYMKETVEIELFYDGEKYKDDVLVGVNGKTWQIKRGEKVKVPRFVAEVIRNSMEQDKVSANQRRKMESDFEREAKKYVGQE